MAAKEAALKILRLEEREVPLLLRRDRRARRLTLRLDEASGAVHLVLPHGVAQAEGLDFARRRSPWILKQLAELPPRVPFVEGARVPYLDVPHEIRHAPGQRRAVRREGGAIWVSGFAEHLPRRVADFLKAEARHELGERSRDKAARIGRRVARVSVRDTRSRWGSCSADGRVNFSWRLILAPEAVLDYVVAHEVAHLEQMNHGPRFWSLVARLTSDTEAARRWLRKEGRGLLRYG